MATVIHSFRELFGRISTYEGTRLYDDVLLPWQSQALETMSVLASYGDSEARLWRKDQPDACNRGDHQVGYTCLEHLYALSRISDLLLLPFEPVRNPEADYVMKHWSDYGEPEEVWIPPIQLEDRNEWLRSLDLQEADHPQFHPFYHEIVEVDQRPNPDEPIRVCLTNMVWSLGWVCHAVRAPGVNLHVVLCGCRVMRWVRAARA